MESKMWPGKDERFERRKTVKIMVEALNSEKEKIKQKIDILEKELHALRIIEDLERWTKTN